MSINEIHKEVKKLYYAYGSKYDKLNELVKFISNRIHVPINTVLEVLQYVESKDKHWITIKLEEALRFSDLMKNASMSSFTRKFNKETNKLMGNPTNHTKLVKAKINKKDDYITFYFLTERTPKYKDNFNLKVVDPKSFTMKDDNLYTIEVRVLDFFKLLNTRPNKDEVTNKDIEDVLFAANLKWWSDVPSFEFQGMNHNMTLFDAAIYPETRPPNHWNKYHNSDQFLDKHSAGVANSIKFYIPQMRMMVKKILGLTKVK
jgi:hypothetical protein